jgi:hypothetical protein
MSKRHPRAHRPRGASPSGSARPPAAPPGRNAPAKQNAASPRDLLARISETPHLARAVPLLPPDVLHGVIERCGLADCGELLALTTTEQLSAVFDLDLWRADTAGTDERFDAARFCAWLEVLAEVSIDDAARRVAAMDTGLVVAGLAPHIAVCDPATFLLPSELEDDDVAISGAHDDRPRREIGGYTIVARRTEWLDTIVAVLVALEAADRASFDRVMGGCRRLSNSKPEVDGLDALLGDAEQSLFDLEVVRERRREEMGYVTPAEGRAFLELSRSVRLGNNGPPPLDPICAAYLRAAALSDQARACRDVSSEGESGSSIASEESAAAIAAIVGVFDEAGVLPQRPRALLKGSPDEPQACALLADHLQFVQDTNDRAATLRTGELAFLANVLVAGCSVQGRPLTPKEAFDAAAATCNLGLENWPLQWLTRSAPGVIDAAAPMPPDFLVSHGLVPVFQVGWTVLHQKVVMFAAEQLLTTLDGIACSDRETQIGLHFLRGEMTRHCRAGAPWRGREALDVIAILDLPAWAALLGLIDELPVMLANVSSGPSRVHSLNPAAFVYISTNTQIASVRDFMQSLPQALAG